MSFFDIQGLGSAQGPARVGPTRAVSQPAQTSEAGEVDDAVEITTMPSSPPPAVLSAVANAAGAYDRLQASGQQLHFGSDPTTGGLTIELQDLSGNPLASVAPSQVLAIADGDAS